MGITSLTRHYRLETKAAPSINCVMGLVLTYTAVNKTGGVSTIARLTAVERDLLEL